MSEERAVLAVDLGTSNTCLVRRDPVEGERQLRPRDCCNTAVGGAIPTLVLYENGEPVAIGAQAEAEYGEASPQERERYSIRALFKPDVGTREAARREMTDFLRLLRARVDMAGTLLVGLPCEAGTAYREHLRTCLLDAGWGRASFLSEPLGAVIHYLGRKALSPSQAARGVLTVDFGGGTCDFSLLRRAAVAGRSGDVLYGGRLFDDLFWQLLLEHNPGLEDELERSGNAYYVHWLSCRQAKEEFSRAMRRDRERRVDLRVRWSAWEDGRAREHSVYVGGLDWSGFLRRAGDYAASPGLLRQLRGHEGMAGLSPWGEALLAGRRVDLIRWFEALLHQSLTSCGDAGMPAVLLTGGSSAWPFVEDCVRGMLGAEVMVLVGDEPYADIARGLASYHSFMEQLRRGRAALEEELPVFVEERLPRVLRRTLEAAADDVAETCGSYLRNAVIVPVCHDFRKNGGSLSLLRERMGEAVEAQSAALELLLEQSAGSLGREVEEAAAEALRLWFQEKGIPILPERLRHIPLGGTEALLAEVRGRLDEAALAPLRHRLAYAVAAALGLAGMAGAGAVGLLASGMAAIPVLAAAGLGGAAVRYTGYGRRMLDRMQDWEIPGMVGSLLTDRRIDALADELVEEFRTVLRRALLASWERGAGRMAAEVGRTASEEIAALDILHVAPV